MSRDYKLIMADGREIEITNIRNCDQGRNRLEYGARAHAIFIAREQGVIGEVLRVEKLPPDPARHARRIAEATGQAIPQRFNGPPLAEGEDSQ